MKGIFVEAKTSDGLSDNDIRDILEQALTSYGKIKKALLLPPDATRANSYAGPVARMLYELLDGAHVDVMPALGTHIPMSVGEIERMYSGIPPEAFIGHNWRTDVTQIGEVPAELVNEVSEGRMNVPIAVEVNRLLLDKSYDIIISVGQVVPHEVVGMSNYNKNIFVGCGGSRMINASHYLGALYGMERIMGRDHSPVHKVFDYAEQNFAMQIPLMYVLTVTTTDQSGVHVQSLAAGRERGLFEQSITVSQKRNINFLDKPLQKVVVYLSPEEFRTTWVGGKSIYRTRMAIADGGELLVIAPGLHRCGEDLQNDKLIKKYGYCGRDKVLRMVEENTDLQDNLSVAAHLIHGSSDGRFSVTCATGGMSRDEIESIGFGYMPLDEAMAKYDVHALKDGVNIVDGEEIFFVSNPALGLWAHRDRFYRSDNMRQE